MIKEFKGSVFHIFVGGVFASSPVGVLGAIVGFKTTASPISQKAVLIAIMAGTFSLFLARGGII